MTYYDYLDDACVKLISMIESLRFEEVCTRAEGDDVSADAIATEAVRLTDVYVALWNKACRAALHDA